ncbi:hypothetical protein EDO6_02093 [Paenibacillus xylanexedens]|nr:hypothetical protein EDO6_02093 [Paenibacillus xylanexedens]
MELELFRDRLMLDLLVRRQMNIKMSLSEQSPRLKEIKM